MVSFICEGFVHDPELLNDATQAVCCATPLGSFSDKLELILE